MASINASVSSTGLISSGDATGNIDLQSNGTTGLSIRSGGKVVLANTALSTASAGTLEYDGGELYFTPLGTQRGVVPGMQYYRLENAFTGANQTAAQSWFNGTGNLAVTLSSNTVYNFEALIYHFKATTSTSHILSSLFGGTATLNNITYLVMNTAGTTAPPVFDSQISGALSTVASATPISTATTTAIYRMIRMFGTVSVNAGGTFIPQYSMSAQPGAGVTTGIGSYFAIWPVGAAGSNTSVGTWA